MQYSCDIGILRSDGNITHVLGVTGNHLSEKTNVDVKAFYMFSGHSHLNRIPKEINKFFPNLIALAWTFGNLTALTAEDLEPFPELQVLYAGGNKLVSLEGDLFKHTPKLEFIYFELSWIAHVGFGLLDSLSNLKYAHFGNNRCIDAFAEHSAQIQELKIKLQNQCPPLDAATFSTATSRNLSTNVLTTSISTTSSLAATSEIVSTIELDSSATLSSSTPSESSETTGTMTDSGQGPIECFRLIKKLMYFFLIHVFYISFT